MVLGEVARFGVVQLDQTYDAALNAQRYREGALVAPGRVARLLLVRQARVVEVLDHQGLVVLDRRCRRGIGLQVEYLADQRLVGTVLVETQDAAHALAVEAPDVAVGGVHRRDQALGHGAQVLV